MSTFALCALHQLSFQMRTVPSVSPCSSVLLLHHSTSGRRMSSGGPWTSSVQLPPPEVRAWKLCSLSMNTVSIPLLLAYCCLLYRVRSHVMWGLCV